MFHKYYLCNELETDEIPDPAMAEMPGAPAPGVPAESLQSRRQPFRTPPDQALLYLIYGFYRLKIIKKSINSARHQPDNNVGA